MPSSRPGGCSTFADLSADNGCRYLLTDSTFEFHLSNQQGNAGISIKGVGVADPKFMAVAWQYNVHQTGDCIDIVVEDRGNT